ncbi:hypothetical protein BDV10DRAFT_160777 [Aspergillus recurvatus]
MYPSTHERAARDRSPATNRCLSCLTTCATDLISPTCTDSHPSRLTLTPTLSRAV